MSRLAPPPASPNCVSSRAPADHPAHIAPLPLPPAGFDQAVALATAIERSHLAERAPGYVRIEYRTRWFGFVDDLELELEGAVLHVRSASRTGHSDLGVNRARVERLRALLLEAE
jgi:uncharacterized protein (DUF1499 family)